LVWPGSARRRDRKQRVRPRKTPGQTRWAPQGTEGARHVAVSMSAGAGSACAGSPCLAACSAAPTYDLIKAGGRVQTARLGTPVRWWLVGLYELAWLVEERDRSAGTSSTSISTRYAATLSCGCGPGRQAVRAAPGGRASVGVSPDAIGGVMGAGEHPRSVPVPRHLHQHLQTPMTNLLGPPNQNRLVRHN
jgi:hypothetical protein